MNIFQTILSKFRTIDRYAFVKVLPRKLGQLVAVDRKANFAALMKVLFLQR